MQSEEYEEYGAVLLAPLAGEPRAPSRIDIGRAIADGRRRRRLLRASATGGAAAVTALAIVGAYLVAGVRGGADDRTSGQSAAASPPSCTIERLAVPDNRKMALVTGGDPSGRYLLGRSYPTGQVDDGVRQVLVWDNGTPVRVDVPGDDQRLLDINSTGTAVGSGFVGGREKPVVYHGGTVRRLPGVTDGVAVAVNEAGVIVGTRQDTEPGTAVRWASPTGAVEVLPLPAGAVGSSARAVDDDGTIAGTVTSTSLAGNRPYVWFPDGTGREMPLPAVDGVQARWGSPLAISDGWVYATVAAGVFAPGASAAAGDPVGTDKTGAVGEVMAFALWNVRTGAVQITNRLGYLTAVNRNGWQAGTDAQGRAALLTPAGQVALPDLRSHAPGQATNIASSVSDDGRVVGGQADDENGVTTAVLWRCR